MLLEFYLDVVRILLGCCSLFCRDSFDACFTTLIQNAENTAGQDPERTLFVIDRLFDMFDTDQNGQIDFSELATGLSIVCGGTGKRLCLCAVFVCCLGTVWWYCLGTV